MRKVELKLEPAKLRITEAEILADLRYPAPAGAPGGRTAGQPRSDRLPATGNRR